MKKTKKNILEPKVKDIKEYLKSHYEENGYFDNLLYDNCIKDARKVKLSQIQKGDVDGPIRVFLLEWGNMRRVLKKEWKESLINLFHNTKIYRKLEKFRKMNLEKADLPSLKKDVEICYNLVSKAIKRKKDYRGPTATSKVLHLLAPNFFPIWDADIRRIVSEDGKSRNYYNFMCKNQDFIKNTQN